MIEDLKQIYPWPDKKPNRNFDDRGWFYKEAEEILDIFLSKQTKIVVELGSWLGKSTRYILNKAPNATIIAVDHWVGSKKWFDNKKDADKYASYIYETFLYNCWDYKERLIPVRERTLEGLDIIYKLNIKPDLIYIDAGHEFAEAIGDIAQSVRLFPESQIVGDDWNWGEEKNYPVRRAAKAIASDCNFKIVTHGTTWYYEN